MNTEKTRADGALSAIKSEQAFIGAFLLCGGDGDDSPRARLAACELECGAITERDFCDARHLPIWAAVRSLIYKHGTADIALLLQSLSETGELSAAGGIDYIAAIEELAATGGDNIAAYATAIKRAADFRRAAAETAALQARLAQPGINGTAAEIIGEFAARLSDIGKNATGKSRRIKLADITPDDDNAPKTESRIAELDNAIGGGFRGGMIYAIGGASGAGKTSLAAQIAAGANAALIIANDMNLQLWRELVYAQHGGENPHCEFEFLPCARNAIDAENIARTWAAECDAKARARRVIIFDMTQSLPPGDDTDSRSSFAERITALMNIIRRIAENTSAAVLLNCAVRKPAKEESGGKNPALESLRDGGDLAYKADAVLIIGDMRDDDDNGGRILRVAKNRFCAARPAMNLTLGNSRRFAISAGAENATGAANGTGANGYAAAKHKGGHRWQGAEKI